MGDGSHRKKREKRKREREKERSNLKMHIDNQSLLCQSVVRE